MSGKRAHSPDETGNDAKRIRSNNGSPAGASAAAPTPVPGSGQQYADRIAMLKARLAAAGKGDSATPTISSTAPPPPPPSEPELDVKKADALRRIAELKARQASTRSNSSNQTQSSDIQASIAAARARAAELSRQRNAPAAPAQTTAQQAVSNDLQARIAELRARTAQSRQGREQVETPPPPPADENVARGGLSVGIHPSLLARPPPESAKARQAARSGAARGNNADEDEKPSNPYLQAEDEDTMRDDETFDPSIVRKSSTRKSKPLALVSQGKYIAQSAALQEQAQLEALKRRIALESKKQSIETASDRSFIVPIPPDIEWWDESMLAADWKTYDDWKQHNRIDSKDSIITAYIQHPVLLVAPQDKLIQAPKAMMLTHTEQKKLRRQRRMADMKEEQAKIRLGLVEPPPPKVKKSNMMRVYGEQAVKDPTAVEARVNREIAQRAQDHEQANEDRKLSKEQRVEKLKKQQAADEAKGLKIAVFRVDNLSSGKHRYQVDVNAKQHALSGIVILHPQMNLVIIEGGVHSVNAYKKLMLNRIKWSENTVPNHSNSSSTFTAAAARNINRDLAEGPSAIDTWLNPLTEQGELKDLSENKCLLVWEGDERQHCFRKWGSRVCETDGEARDTLARSKMENMWELARGTTE